MEKSSIFNATLTITKVVTLVLIIILAIFNFDSANLTPFTLEKYGFNGTMYGASLIYFGYLGFDVITTLSDEAKNPVRDVPLSVRDNNLIVTVIYFATAFSLVSIARLETFHPETAFAEAFNSIGMPWVTIVIYFCAFIGITATCFSQHIA
jgi:APA family basic amino acid/polyamine antiporter